MKMAIFLFNFYTSYQINQKNTKTMIQNNSTLSWGTEQAQTKTSIDFDDLFASPDLSALDFLEINHIVDECKRQNEKVTNKLVEEKSILKDLIDVALRPKISSKTHLRQIKPEHTFRSIEILNCLGEQFMDFLFDNNKNNKIQQDQVLQEQCTSSNSQFLQHLFKLLEDPQPIEQTPLSYLTRLTIPFCYHKPQQVIKFLSENPLILEQLFNHIYSLSLFQWVIRLLQVQDSYSFFEKQKILMLRECTKQIDKEKNTFLLCEKLENYRAILENMLEKLDDRFDKAKYASMIKQLIVEKFCLDFVFVKAQEYEKQPEIITKIINILQIYLKFSQSNRATNPNTSKFSEGNSESSIYEIRLNNDHIGKIKEFIKEKASILTNEKFSRKSVISYLRLMKSMNNIDNQFIGIILNTQNTKNIFRLVERYENNNILHNIVKEIFTDGISKSFQYVSELFFNQESYYMSLVVKITSKNSKKLYENQIYHIFQALVKKSEEISSQKIQVKLKSDVLKQINSIVNEKQNFYSKLIGGNPRKQSNSWGDSSQEILFADFFPKESKIINLPSSEEKDKENQETIHGGCEHWFDCNLPLDSEESEEESLEEVKKEEIHEELEDDGVFTKHFDSYLSYSADNLLEQVNY